MNNSLSPKVAAGAGGAGASAPLSIIIIWLIGLSHVTIPPEVAAAIGALVALGCGALAGFLTPHDPTTAAALTQFFGAQRAQGVTVPRPIPPAPPPVVTPPQQTPVTPPTIARPI